MPDTTLVIEDLHVNVEDKQILRGVDLTVEAGRVHALMGPNGSGKSTLAYALAGHPRYRVTGGKVTFKGEDVLAMTPDERARLGMFLAMQYPVEVPGVSVTNFLRTAMNAVRGEDVPVRQFAKDLREQMRLLDMDPRFAERSLNEGFSGGEKKRHEILQMALLRPSWPSSTRPTRAWTWTPCGWSPTASTGCAAPSSACSSSPTTPASCATSPPTWST
jgi:Fe-S cluster assembly ATP-binding protein